MKLSFVVFLLFAANTSFAQGKSVHMSSADEVTSTAALASLITANDTTNLQKVTSIFSWITDNIAYNVKRYQNSRSKSDDYWMEEDEDTSAVLQPLNERVAARVLKKRTAVCDGYARLFKRLCDHVGIQCEIITGYAKGSVGRIGAQFKSNHKWNAVFIDSSWHLLDVTWASGYINYRNEFEKEYNRHYFLTPPNEFILDHYPEDLRWTLLPYPPTIKEFSNTPFKTAAFNTNYIISFKPITGVIEASVGDSIVIELETNRYKKNLWVIDIPYVDSNAIAVMQCCGVNKPENSIRGNKVSYTYVVKSDNVDWLSVIYDDEMIMRYRLNVKTQLQANKTIYLTQ